MSKRDPVVALKHMLDHAQKAVAISRGRKRKDLDENLTFNLALTRLIEIIGEAANRVPEEFQEEHPEIAWTEMVGMRNRLIHGYDEVDLEFLWSVVKNDLPGLITQLKQLL
jgi:uncharacterized protein with HEPN domain